jgi:hypothetical protein
MKRLFLLLPLFYFLSSCSLSTKRDKIRQVDKIYFEIRFIEHSLNSINSDSIALCINIINQSVDKLKGSPKKLIDDEFNTQFLIPYSDAGKILNNVFSSKSKILGEISTSLKQLNDLKSDVKAGHLSKSEFEEYLKQEKQEAEIINEEVKSLKGAVNLNLKLYQRIRPIINQKVEKIKI